jgi:nicotinate-nucleotide adenylyltransferase
LAALGLFGGTFDPVHFGHLRLATELAEAFHLDKVVFIPRACRTTAGRDAHATADQRLTMLKLATQRDARFDVDDRELKRSGNTYSYDTLAEIRQGARPGNAAGLPRGHRLFAQIDTWHRWTELFDLAHFAVAVRADDPAVASREAPAPSPREAWPRITLNPRELASAPAGKIMTFAMTPLSISSTAIRALAAEGASIRYSPPTRSPSSSGPTISTPEDRSTRPDTTR